MVEWRSLPEVDAPPGVAGCQRCPLALQRTRVIWGEGNPQAPMLVVLDNPGAREDAAGEPFVCGTRQTLQACVQEAGLSLDDLYVTWVLKCRPRRAYDKEAARAACLPYLSEQLEGTARKVVVPLGNVALQAYLGESEAEVKALRGRVLEYEGQRVVCGYHPLAVHRRPNLLPLLVADLRLAGTVVSGRQP